MSGYVVTSEDLKSFGKFLLLYADDKHFTEWFEETPMATRMKGPTEIKYDSLDPDFPNKTQSVPAPVYYQGFHYSVFEKFFLQAVRELVFEEETSISRSQFQRVVDRNRNKIIKRMQELYSAAAAKRQAEIAAAAAEGESSGDEIGGGKRRRRSKRVSRKNRRKTKKNYTSKCRSKRRSNRRSNRRSKRHR